jgi:hypothetical protein
MLAAPIAMPTPMLPAPSGPSAKRGSTGSTMPIDRNAKKVAACHQQERGRDHPVP